ncbi:MAG: endolytic transglycosylase MltG [Candidatus Latescibacteria bacterium]|nr:endolytic transglycosylase MltG [Candidatus Latescibacterota bacterium]
MMTPFKKNPAHRLRKTALFVGSFAYLLYSTYILILFTIFFHVLLSPFRLTAFLIRVRQDAAEKGKDKRKRGKGNAAAAPLSFILYPLSFILLCALSVGASAFFLNRPTDLADSRKIVIQSGMTVRRIGQLLQEQGLIRSTRFFVLMARLSGIEGRLEAGEYRLNGRKTTYRTMWRLTQGVAITKNVTIPEGRTLREIAGILRLGVAIDSVRFVDLASDSTFCHELGVQASTLEGYLFPDTYNLFYRMDERAILKTMIAHFREVFSDSLRQRADALGLDLHQAVILASLVEGEAQVARERPIIASIFHRRLRLGRALESCATVQYALGRRKTRLRNHDLKTDSPYNTYLHRGLPPGPIGNPGRAALRATLYPAEVEYLYFVSRGDGTHIFSKSLRAHINAKNRIKKTRNRK